MAEYIADFQRLSALIGAGLGDDNALHAFMRGLRTDISNQLEVAGIGELPAAIEVAARIGGVMSVSQGIGATHGAVRTGAVSSVRQMQLTDTGDASLDTRIEQVVLNVMHAQRPLNGAMSDSRANTDITTSARGGRGGRGGRGRGRGGRWGSEHPMPSVPGVSADEVRRRWDARQCLRCGDDGHRVLECGNAISSQS